MRDALRLIPALLVALGGILFTAAVTTVVGEESLTVGGIVAGGAGVALVVVGFALRYTRLRRAIAWLAPAHIRLLTLHGEYKRLHADLAAAASDPDALDRPAFEERVRDLDASFRQTMVDDWEFDWAATKRTEEYRPETFPETWSHQKWIGRASAHALERLKTLERLMRTPAL